MANSIEIHPIGIIHSPYREIKHMPIQPLAAHNVKGTVEVFSQYIEGLKDLEGFSHITLVYHFHESKGFKLQVVPFMDTKLRGVFATRAPKRPNGIGISTVKLLKVEGNILHIEQVDVLDGTPLIDIKPFSPRFDNRLDAVSGWLDKSANTHPNDMKADERFK